MFVNLPLRISPNPANSCLHSSSQKLIQQVVATCYKWRLSWLVAFYLQCNRLWEENRLFVGQQTTSGLPNRKRNRTYYHIGFISAKYFAICQTPKGFVWRTPLGDLCCHLMFKARKGADFQMRLHRDQSQACFVFREHTENVTWRLRIPLHRSCCKIC